MYSKVFEGKKVRISNSHRKLLLKRFDINKFERVPPALMRNKVACVLCQSFHNPDSGMRTNYCKNCPFDVFGTRPCAGCYNVIRSLLSPNKVIYLYRDSVSYSVHDGVQASKELRIVTDFLKSFKKER